MTWNERQDIDGNGNGYELKWMREHPATPEGSVCILLACIAFVVLAGLAVWGLWLVLKTKGI
jgi:hypothetical protein